MLGTCCNRNCRSRQLVHNIYVWIFFFMVSHTIMTIIQCMIMAYVLTIGQVQTLQPVDASLSRATCYDDILTSLAGRILLLPAFMVTSFSGPVYTTINMRRIVIYPGKFKCILVKISRSKDVYTVDMSKIIKLQLRLLLLEIYPDSPVYMSVNTERIKICSIML